jgi:hypothetical protein
MSVYTVGSNKSSDSIFPKVRPSLDLDFANSKTLDPRITFTRSSGGSYVGADGLIKYAGVNEARFDHNPVTGESLGLLIEEPRTNLINGSDNFGILNWSRISQGTISANVITAPDGTTTADKFIENTLSVGPPSHKVIAKDVTISANTTYTVSIFVKAAERSNILIHLRETNFIVRFGGFFNLSNKTFINETAGGATLVSSSITPLPNEWYRLSISGNLGAITASVVTLYLTNSSNNIEYAGNGNSGLFIWGAQLEAGAFPTSYIPTVASTRTRAADNAQITGTNFSSWYNQAEGTVSISCITRGALNSGSNYADFLISNSFTTTYTSRIIGWFNNLVIPYMSVFVNNITILLPFIGVPGSSSNIPIKKAIALATRNMRVATNGTIITGNLGNTTVPNYLPNDFNRLLLGYEGIFAGYLNGTISRFTYYPKPLPNSQLQALTR